MTDRELMQEALDALTYVGDKDIYSDTIDALRARLAQPEPEPEKSQDKPCVEDDGCPTEKAVLQRFWREHQAQPEREWVGLTDAEAMEIEDTSPDIRWAIIQAEAKLKEKNT